MKKIVLVIMLSAFGSGVCYAGGWTGYGIVDGMYVTTQTGAEAIIIMHTSGSNPEGCASGAKYYFVEFGSLLDKQAYSFLLSVHMTGKSVRFYLDGCNDKGWPVVVNIDTRKI